MSKQNQTPIEERSTKELLTELKKVTSKLERYHSDNSEKVNIEENEHWQMVDDIIKQLKNKHDCIDTIIKWDGKKAKKAAKITLSKFELETFKGKIKCVSIKEDGGVYINNNDLPTAFIGKNKQDAKEAISKIKSKL